MSWLNFDVGLMLIFPATIYKGMYGEIRFLLSYLF